MISFFSSSLTHFLPFLYLFVSLSPSLRLSYSFHIPFYLCVLRSILQKKTMKNITRTSNDIIPRIVITLISKWYFPLFPQDVRLQHGHATATGSASKQEQTHCFFCYSDYYVKSNYVKLSWDNWPGKNIKHCRIYTEILHIWNYIICSVS